jgi:LPXTG-site transpeptidase (sortase) family protein
VLQAEWEAPPFAVGQIKRTAHITEGNTVLIGHLTGAAGNVFQHLDQLELGDPVTAISRGVSYPFVVSRIFISSNTDASPIDPTSDERLTLMTCAGVWNPFTHDYSERLWVIAEPPDQAAETLASTEPTATAEAEARMTATEAAASTATASVPEPTATPIPFVGQVSAPGGLGNTRGDLSTALGTQVGQTQAGLEQFRQGEREYRVLFSPDSGRAVMLVESPLQGVRLTLDVAMQDARRLLPRDVSPQASGPEGNPQFVVERFSSAALEDALGRGDISAVYVRGPQNSISSVVLGLGDDYGALIDQSRQ